MRYFERVIVGLAHEPVDIDVLRYARLIRALGHDRTQVTFVHVLAPADVAALHEGPVAPLVEVRADLETTVTREFGAEGRRVERPTSYWAPPAGGRAAADRSAAGWRPRRPARCGWCPKAARRTSGVCWRPSICRCRRRTR
jgi:hypothetical protein